MPSPVSDVHCPHCHERFYIHRPDYEEHPDAYCYCPFCHQTFDVQAGQPHPPVVPR